MVQLEGKLGLVLSGGGGRGAFEAGVLHGLNLDPCFHEPEVVAGTSAGAINAALLAAGKSSEQIRDFWFELGAARPAAVNDAFLADVVTQLFKLVTKEPLRTLKFWSSRQRGRRGPISLVASLLEVALTDRIDLSRTFLSGVHETSVATTKVLRNILLDAFGGELVLAKRCALAINAVDARANIAVRFVNRRTPRTGGAEYVVVPHITIDMVLASASIPLFFPAVPLDGRLLWDGGVLNNTPMAAAVALGAERIATVLVTSLHTYDRKEFDTLENALQRLLDTLLENAYNVDRQLLLTRNRLADLAAPANHQDCRSHEHIHLYSAIRPARDTSFDAGSLLDFNRPSMEELYRHGRSAVSAWLRAGPLVDSATESVMSLPGFSHLPQRAEHKIARITGAAE